MTARSTDSPRYSYGYEWTNARGQVFVMLPDHPRARADGFYPRSRYNMEGVVGRILLPAERVYHLDEDPGNDSVTEYDEGLRARLRELDPAGLVDTAGNLVLFASQKDLAQYRSREYHKRKADLGGGYAALTPGQRDYQLMRAEEVQLSKEQAAAEEREALRLTRLREAMARRKAEKEGKAT